MAGGAYAHQTKEEAQKETLDILELYKKLAEEYLAIPVYTGLKTEAEKFAGADKTYCIEAMMLDKRLFKLAHLTIWDKIFLKHLMLNFKLKIIMKNMFGQLAGV